MEGSGSSISMQKCGKCLLNSNQIPQISNSEKNPGRPYYKCSRCGQFVKWAAPRARMMEMEGSSHGHHESI